MSWLNDIGQAVSGTIHNISNTAAEAGRMASRAWHSGDRTPEEEAAAAAERARFAQQVQPYGGPNDPISTAIRGSVSEGLVNAMGGVGVGYQAGFGPGDGTNSTTGFHPGASINERPLSPEPDYNAMTNGYVDAARRNSPVLQYPMDHVRSSSDIIQKDVGPENSPFTKGGFNELTGDQLRYADATGDYALKNYQSTLGHGVNALTARAPSDSKHTAATSGESHTSQNDFAASLGGLGGTLGAIATPAAIIGSGLVTADATKKASQDAADAAAAAATAEQTGLDKVIALNREQYDQSREDTRPWRETGERALGRLENFDTDHPDFGMTQFNQDPGYHFRLDEGMKALEHSAAARGSAFGGNTMKAMMQYGQDSASQEYGNAFNRYQTQKGMKLNNLQGLAGVGQTSVQQAGQAGQSYSNGVGNAMTSQGRSASDAINNASAARSSGYIGNANAFGNTVNSLLNNYQSQQWLSKLGAS